MCCWPLYLVPLMYLCLVSPVLFALVEGADVELSQWRISFLPRKVDMLVEMEKEAVKLYCDDCSLPPGMSENDVKVVLDSDDPSVASVDTEGGPLVDKSENSSVRSFTFNVSANFLGFAKIHAHLDVGGTRPASPSATLPVAVVRRKTVQSKVFAYSVALLISIAYINMGCAMDLGIVKEQLRRPVGPVIGFICQFVVMPLLSFVLGYIFDSAPMRLGLFVTGTSPGGGASNIWTLMFGGNLSLSVTMTAISTFFAFVMMPLWIFTLGTVIFSDSEIIIPYYKISTYAIGLVVPLSIGLLISRYLPKLSQFLVSVLKPLALFLIFFILIFGIWANLYMFELMSWKVIIAGMLLPWLGFACGCTLARLCGRCTEDVTAIAIETGVQNTGMSIFILWFTLDHPLGDLAAVIPVASATMTPIPLLAALLLLKVRECHKGADDQKCEDKDVKKDVEVDRG